MSGYERRIGRYGPSLAAGMVALARPRPGERALDVGCGSGALAERLAEAVGAASVAAVDPSPAETAACARRVPGADVRVARGEDLPFADACFDVVLAQLVVHLADDAERIAAEMRRVARPGGRVATCVWDFAGGMTALRLFWDAARAAGAPGAGEHDQAGYRYAAPAALERLWRGAGLERVETGELVASSRYDGFADLWEPLAVPDGTPGRFLATLTPEQARAVERELLARTGDPSAPFELEARAWYVLGRAPV